MAGWRVLGASVAGFLHEEAGRGCDDAHGWTAGEASVVLAIADGAGSRPGTSAIGAHVATASVLEASDDPGFAGSHAEDPAAAASGLVEHALAAVAAEARALEVEVGALATTLAVAVLSGDHVTVAQIGDGVAVLERADGAIEAVALAEQFEYANEVVFLTAKDALDHLKVFTAAGDSVRGVALTTDGLRYKVLDDLRASRPFEPFFRDSWSYARSDHARSAALEAFLNEVDDQTGDDKTLLLAVNDFTGDAGEARRLTDRPPPPIVEAPAASEAEDPQG